MRFRLLFIGLLCLLGGCFRSSPQRSLRALTDELNAVCDTLVTVQDPASATAALGKLDGQYARVCADMKQWSQVMIQCLNKATSKDEFTQLNEDFMKAIHRLGAERRRLLAIRGLPQPFWKIIATRNNEMMLALDDSMTEQIAKANSPGASELMKLMASEGQDRSTLNRNTRQLLESCGFENMLYIYLDNVPDKLRQPACDRVAKLAPSATLYHMRGDGYREEIVLGPIGDVTAFAAKLDLGTIAIDDEGQRLLQVTVDRRKLGAKANSDDEEFALEDAEFRRKVDESERKWKEEKAKMEAEDKRFQQEQWEAEHGPDPKDPQYYDKLADCMLSHKSLYTRQAIELLAGTDPAKIASRETRQKIARTFRTLVENPEEAYRGEAMKGLAAWAGKYSVPILLKVLDEQGISYCQDEAVAALADLKDPRAAPALAKQLEWRSNRAAAARGLNGMGSAAEDALIANESSYLASPEGCAAALEVLGNVGSPKCLAFIESIRSIYSDADVHTAAREAIAKIKARQ